MSNVEILRRSCGRLTTGRTGSFDLEVSIARYLPGDNADLRKGRGAFFTPYDIAEYLAGWAVGNRCDAKVLDPTSGEGVFLLAAGRRLAAAGASPEDIARQLHGVDLHEASLDETARLLAGDGIGATLHVGDFFDELPPNRLGGTLPYLDAVIGNPPFVRYQQHRGDDRKKSATAAFAQGVRLSGLASSWAALLVHVSGFLKDDGRIAMVLPAELLTVGYAEPIRQWLRGRFAAVHLVLFEQLQFRDADEQVVLLVAQGTGGCDAFALHQVRDADELSRLHVFDGTAVAPSEQGKWTDMLLTPERRGLFRKAAAQSFVPLSSYGQPELGTVTGANSFFAMTEATREQFDIPHRHLIRICPPGTRHLHGTRFTNGTWEQLRQIDNGRVWLLHPRTDTPIGGLADYIEHGKELKVDEAYKCTVRKPWWRPPAAAPPDLIFTYMSHRYPRLIANEAGASVLNSVHGVRLRGDAPEEARDALPLLAFNSVTMLGAELYGRSYGGGILKMEPREAALLPLPDSHSLRGAWKLIEPQCSTLDGMVREGQWQAVVDAVDDALLRQVVGLKVPEVAAVRSAAAGLRRRRTREAS